MYAKLYKVMLQEVKTGNYRFMQVRASSVTDVKKILNARKDRHKFVVRGIKR